MQVEAEERGTMLANGHGHTAKKKPKKHKAKAKDQGGEKEPRTELVAAAKGAELAAKANAGGEESRDGVQAEKKRKKRKQEREGQEEPEPAAEGPAGRDDPATGVKAHRKLKRREKKKQEVREAQERVVEAGQASSEKVPAAPPAVRRTLSIAVSAAIIQNAQTLEAATALAGQIARAAAVFRVDEVVIFDEPPLPGDRPFSLSSPGAASGPRPGRASPSLPAATRAAETASGGGPGSEVDTGGALFARILQYLDTPQYLRRLLVPMRPDLRYAGLLPPLDAPHQPRSHEWTPFREGAVLPGPDRGGGADSGAEEGEGGGCLAEVGLERPVRLRQRIPPGTRVTVAMGHSWDAAFAPGAALEAVSPEAPLEASQAAGERRADSGHIGASEGAHQPSKARAGGGAEDEEGEGEDADEDGEGQGGGAPACVYWGYTVRLCQGLSAALRGAPYSGGYDLVVGTSERGRVVRPSQLHLAEHRHALVVFGGPRGLEDSMRRDAQALGGTSMDPASLFQHYLNTCPHQGSRTIRTHEALLISLSFLTEPLGRFLT